MPGCDRATEAPDVGRIALWQISQPGASDGPRAHVLTTVALHDTNTLRFDPAIEAAFSGSRRLVLPNESALDPTLFVILTKALLEEGDSLSRRLPPDVHAAYTASIGRAGFPPGTGEQTAPWFAALVIAGADYKRLGFVDPGDVESYFVQRAALERPSIEVVPLESSAERYDRYAALPPDLQVDMMRVALGRAPHSDEVLPALEAAWRRGDATAIEALLTRGDDDSPATRRVRETNVAAEAERLATALRRSLEAGAPPGDSFWIVPSELAVGEGGLLARLEAAGLAVEQQRSATGGETLQPPPTLAVPALPAAQPVEAPGGRVLVVGIDGATLRVIEPLLERGRLPALASLAASGASGPLRSHKPIHSPRIWGSIATGTTPEHHGIRGFTFRDEAGTQQLYLSHHRKAHAIWNVFSEAGLTVGVVNWWNTWPPEVVRGTMISDHAVPTRLDDPDAVAAAASDDAAGPKTAKPRLDVAPGTTTYPVEWADRVAAALDERSALTAIEDPFLGVVGIPHFMQREKLSKRFRDDATITRIALELDRSESPDLLMVFLPGIDRVSHRLWGALEPAERYGEGLQLTESQRGVVRTALERYYEYTDALIGLLLARYGPDDLELVLSDHGFEGGEDLASLTGIHETEAALDGVLFARGPGVEAGASTRGTSVNDVTPTVLAWRGLALADDFDGRVAAFLTPPVEQPERIATYDVREIERLDATASGSEEEIMDRLRALGYIE